LGGVLDFAFQAGIKEMRRTSIGSDGLIVYNDSTRNLQVSPFIGTRSLISFDFGKKRRNVNCDFVNCFREMNSVWKFGMTDLFYVDLQEANINLNIDYEKRIRQSSFSSNSTFLLSGGLKSQFVPTGNTIQVDRGLGLGGFGSFQIPVPTFFDEREIVGNGLFRFEQNIRYYAFQKRNIARGKTSQNLNGLYLAASAALSSGPNLSLNLPFEYRNQKILQEIGGGLGVQKIIGSKYFIDYSVHFYPLTNVGGWAEFEPTVYAKLNFGLAKRAR
jgi:hypothetical protein